MPPALDCQSNMKWVKQLPQDHQIGTMSIGVLHAKGLMLSTNDKHVKWTVQSVGFKRGGNLGTRDVL